MYSINRSETMLATVHDTDKTLIHSTEKKMNCKKSILKLI